jgi:hypothetical protein
MSIIPGNNVTITAAQIVGSTSSLIIRTPTANSSDTLDTASNIILAFYGVNDGTYDGDSFDLDIYNDSSFIITLNPGSGITMNPTPTDQILPQTTRTYTFVKTSGSTMDIYLRSSGTAYDQSGLNLTNNRIFVGNSINIATDVAMSGDISIINTGATSLVATSNSTLTTLSGLTTALSLSSIGTITTGTWNGTLISPTFGGTGVNNATRTLTLGGNLTTLGAFASTFTMTGATAVTFPTSGTLATTATANVSSVSGTTNRITVSPTTGACVVDISAAYVGQSSITTLGTITTGVWNGTLISPTFGGTGVNNATRTLTLGGNLTTSGAFASTFTMTGATAVTFPTTGTLLSNTPAALTKTDDTNVTLTLGGTPATALLQATSITVGWSGTLAPTRGGTGVNNGTNTLTLAGNLATSGAFASTFTMTGATNVTFPTSGTLATTAGTVSSVSGTTNRITSTGGTTPVIDISAAYVGQSSITTLGTITTGVWNGTLISPTFGGTGVNNGSSTLTLAGNLATSGAFASTFTMTGATAVTFPTTGTLATTSQLPTPAALTRVDDTNVTLTLGGTPATALLQATSITAGWTGQLSLTRGGTNASLTASNGGIFYSTATAGAILAGTATARQMLQSGASTTPAWSTATWPATTTVNRLLFSSATNTVGEVTTANSAVLVTSSAGVPTYSSTMTNGQVIIGSTGATPVAASLTAGSGISITNGAGTITVANSVPLFRAFGPSAAITPGAFPVAFTTLTTYNAPTFDAGTYSYAAGVVTILVAGVYEVCFTVQFNSNGNTGSVQGSFQGRIIQNGASVNGSITQCNMPRIAGTNNRTHCTKAWIITAALNDTVAIQYAETTTNTVFQVTQNESVFTIKRLQ